MPHTPSRNWAQCSEPEFFNIQCEHKASVDSYNPDD